MPVAASEAAPAKKEKEIEYDSTLRIRVEFVNIIALQIDDIGLKTVNVDAEKNEKQKKWKFIKYDNSI